MIDLVYLLPLCLVVSLVYEATHGEDMRRIFRTGLRMFVMMALGIVGLAALMLVLGLYL